jgi:XapX domain-containing protein
MRFLCAALGGLLIATQFAGAQGILRLPASTRALGMGNVAVAGRDDDVIFYNPAQLVVARGTTLSGERDSESLATGALSSAIAFSTGGVGVGATFSRIDVPSPALNQVPLTSVVGTAAAAQVVKTVRVGIAAKYLGQQVSSQYESRTMFDVGLARGFRQYFTGGLAVQNIGIAGRDLFGEAPVKATLGASGAAPAGPYDVVFTAALSMDDHDHQVRPAGGGEIGWSWLNGYNVALRAGLRDPLPGERAFTAGVGFVVDRVSVDYALETLAGSRVGQRIGVRVR